ncbi:hypothetical protein [Microbacterium sp. cx-59]|uniref:hypothetical protein n=1 Tax=Microbacterium sp. cx-59 TaxID=2891207 RepID=UPI001E5877A2|nr:hypothetical protein [Microbacterium sp. cx-59]MCC4908411.1 hypothetical protein [Microbacterium sp. cx-59]
MNRRRRLVIALAACGAGAVAVATVATGAALAATDQVPLAPLVAAWPDAYAVQGQKSEPLYTEHIDLTRTGDVFSVRIDVRAQGDAALGTQDSTVTVNGDGTVVWNTGCVKSPALCAGDTELRGFLATAALVGLERAGRLPETGTARTVHDRAVVCVDDAALHPDAAPAQVRLDPCFDRATGAVLAHWSPDSAAFVGATLAPGATVRTLP